MSLSPNLRGAVMMMAGMTSFTLSDACMKAIGTSMPLSQSLLLRGVAVTALLILVVWRAGAATRMGRRAWELMLLRALAESGAAWFFFLALFQMPLANVSAVM